MKKYLVIGNGRLAEFDDEVEAVKECLVNGGDKTFVYDTTKGIAIFSCKDAGEEIGAYINDNPNRGSIIFVIGNYKIGITLNNNAITIDTIEAVNK